MSSKEPTPNTFMRPPARLLIIRFSSFGDIIQAVGVPAAFRALNPNAEVDWLVREDFRGLLSSHPQINRVLSFSRSQGLIGLLKLAWHLSSDNYTHVYDAHNNIRSWLVSLIFTARAFTQFAGGRRPPRFLRRPKDRLRRWLLFRFGLPVLPRPFRGAESFHRPLAPWGIAETVPSGPQFHTDAQLPDAAITQLQTLPKPIVVLAPSAAWEMKRWPIRHWQKLITCMPETAFAIVGGPEDHFLDEIAQIAPERTINFAGRLSLAQTSALLKQADLVIANDTGTMHVADQLERPTIALIGPTAFGYPSHRTSLTAEIDLPCKPCSKDGRGGCKNSVYQRCLVELEPLRVVDMARSLLIQRTP